MVTFSIPIWLIASVAVGLPTLLAVWFLYKAHRKLRDEAIDFRYASNRGNPDWQWFKSSVDGVRFRRTYDSITFEVSGIARLGVGMDDTYEFLGYLHRETNEAGMYARWIHYIGTEATIGLFNLLGKGHMVSQMSVIESDVEEPVTGEPVSEEQSEHPELQLFNNFVHPGARRNRNLEL